MPPNTPHDRSPHPRAPYSPPAPFTHARPTTEARSTSYSSLDQALVLPSSSRDASDRRAHQSSRDAHRGGPSMSSESRYMPYSPAEPPAQYGYQYPPYDTAQYPPSASRPARPSAAQGQPSPSQQPPQQPPTSYAAPQASSGPYSHPPPHYTTTAYPVPNQSWQPEGWQPYSTSFAPSNASVSEPPQSFARPETQSQPPGKAARAPSAGPSNPDNRRAEERAERPSEAAPQPSKARKAREPVENAAPTPVTPTAALDFVKLVDTYRLILDSTTPLVNTTGHIDAERMEQMLQAAVYGAEALEAAAKRSAPELPRAGPTGIERSGNEPEGGTGKARQGNSSKSDQSVENQTCLGCSATSTPEWRRGPLGPRTLCNACGLVYAKLIKKRTREPGRVRSGHSKQSRADGYSSGDDGSDAESSGSHEKRSDMGEASRRG